MLDDLLIAYLHTCEDPVLYTSGRVLRFGGDVTLCGALFNAEHPSLQSVPSLALRDSALFSFFAVFHSLAYLPVPCSIPDSDRFGHSVPRRWGRQCPNRSASCR